MKNLESDLNKITQLAKDKDQENREFCSFLKDSQDSKKIDKIVHSLYKQISKEIDCTSCGNCCKLMDPVFKKKDIEKLFNVWGVEADKSLKKHFIEAKKENGFIFKTPCPLLKETKCSQYLSRPAGCKSYPHLHKKNSVFKVKEVIENYSICPIVFNVYEDLKAKIWHDLQLKDI